MGFPIKMGILKMLALWNELQNNMIWMEKVIGEHKEKQQRLIIFLNNN